MIGETLQLKFDGMRDILQSLPSAAVAFSAGVDSTVVLKVALDVLGNDKVVAATASSASLPEGEFAEACRLAELLGARHVVLQTDEFEDENYLTNPADRCYYCKTSLYTHLGRYIREHDIGAIVSGANADDYDDWRPGIKAADESHVRAPLAEAGISKSEVRELAGWLDLPVHDKPASPCLSSRVQYGERITPEKLRRIERAESFLKQMGLRECRVRHHDNLARIEVPAANIQHLADPQVREKIDRHLRELGYNYVTLDLRGFRSGSMNEVIEIRVERHGHQ